MNVCPAERPTPRQPLKAEVPPTTPFHHLPPPHSRPHYATEEEAAYLAAELNSDAVNDAIKPFQARGVPGKRHIHKKPLELSLRLYNDKNPLHVELATGGKEAMSRRTVRKDDADGPSDAFDATAGPSAKASPQPEL